MVVRLTGQIARRNRGVADLAFVGIKRRGVPLAERLAAIVNKGRTKRAPVGAIDITLYRDDLQLVSETPIVRGSEIGFDVNGRTLVLVDDVLFTARTVRAALTEILDYGRPRAVQLAVLVDRGGRELPIQADYCGLVLKTRPGDIVDVCLKELDGKDGVKLTPAAHKRT
jgi:pyrimidine operon attenuation protein/uracil phosphoribosyltransferase